MYDTESLDSHWEYLKNLLFYIAEGKTLKIDKDKLQKEYLQELERFYSKLRDFASDKTSST